jgi:alkylhydroperoxidase/carboxymuconolactone decarboxylase family protein YurZ
MSVEERRAAGARAYASQFAVPASEVPALLNEWFGARMAEEGLMAMGGSAWDDTLSRRERSMIVVGALIALGGVDERLRGHVRAALANGVTHDELDALASMLAVYVGFPRATAGMRVIKELEPEEEPRGS